MKWRARKELNLHLKDHYSFRDIVSPRAQKWWGRLWFPITRRLRSYFPMLFPNKGKLDNSFILPSIGEIPIAVCCPACGGSFSIIMTTPGTWALPSASCNCVSAFSLDTDKTIAFVPEMAGPDSPAA